ncbi:hypothetical protein MJI95_26655, partial [Salmonella enterica subsp. enterica serovar Kentucky]|nr:hypothetical protein [Salmonella enterica subsp. enterica serovar Kentucky]
LADNLASLLEPALLIITGLIIGTLVVAMYLPIFHLGDAKFVCVSRYRL